MNLGGSDQERVKEKRKRVDSLKEGKKQKKKNSKAAHEKKKRNKVQDNKKRKSNKKQKKNPLLRHDAIRSKTSTTTTSHSNTLQPHSTSDSLTAQENPTSDRFKVPIGMQLRDAKNKPILPKSNIQGDEQRNTDLVNMLVPTTPETSPEKQQPRPTESTGEKELSLPGRRPNHGESVDENPAEGLSPLSIIPQTQDSETPRDRPTKVLLKERECATDSFMAEVESIDSIPETPEATSGLPWAPFRRNHAFDQTKRLYKQEEAKKSQSSERMPQEEAEGATSLPHFSAVSFGSFASMPITLGEDCLRSSEENCEHKAIETEEGPKGFELEKTRFEPPAAHISFSLWSPASSALPSYPFSTKGDLTEGNIDNTQPDIAMPKLGAESHSLPLPSTANPSGSREQLPQQSDYIKLSDSEELMTLPRSESDFIHHATSSNTGQTSNENESREKEMEEKRANALHCTPYPFERIRKERQHPSSPSHDVISSQPLGKNEERSGNAGRKEIQALHKNVEASHPQDLASPLKHADLYRWATVSYTPFHFLDKCKAKTALSAPTHQKRS